MKTVFAVFLVVAVCCSGCGMAAAIATGNMAGGILNAGAKQPTTLWMLEQTIQAVKVKKGLGGE